MEEKHMIDVVKADGSTQEAEVLLLFKLEETGPQYIIYTFNEVDVNALLKVYTSLFKETDTGFVLEDVPSEDAWMQVKEVMRKVINGDKE